MPGTLRTCAARAASAARPLLLLIVLTGCDDRTPRRTPEYTVSGGETLAWNQQAAGADELTSLFYAAYVGGERHPLVEASCLPQPTDGAYSCSSPLPMLTPGRHTLELVAQTVLDGRVVESRRSAPVLMTVVAGPANVHATIPDGGREFVSQGRRYRAEIVVRNVTRPAALAFTPDGRLWIAERDGTVSIVQQDRVFAQTPLSVESLHTSADLIAHDLILHPDFDRTRFVLLLYSVVGVSDAFTRLVRFREVGNVLTEPQILLERTASRLGPTAAMMFGQDGMVYVATNEPDPAAGGASATGQLLRFDDDGWIPRGHSSASPVLAAGLLHPVAMGHSRINGRIWLVDRSERGVEQDAQQPFDSVLKPRAADALFYTGSTLPAFRDSLFVASAEDEKLEWLRFDNMLQRWTADGVLLSRWLGRLGTVGEGPDGLLYVGTDNSVPPAASHRDVVLRIVPAERRQKSDDE